jgi:hypothetical protein
MRRSFFCLGKEVVRNGGGKRVGEPIMEGRHAMFGGVFHLSGGSVGGIIILNCCGPHCGQQKGASTINRGVDEE